MRSVSAAADNPDANQKISYAKDISIFLLMSIFNIIDKDRLRPAAVRKTHRFIVRGDCNLEPLCWTGSTRIKLR